MLQSYQRHRPLFSYASYNWKELLSPFDSGTYVFQSEVYDWQKVSKAWWTRFFLHLLEPFESDIAWETIIEGEQGMVSRIIYKNADVGNEKSSFQLAIFKSL